ncbi:MAG: hypothetical protein ACXAEN_13835 [Candidatus Thorarchaeota archaeon]|jgi:hypothetical protein
MLSIEQIEEIAEWLEADEFRQLDFDDSNRDEWALSGHGIKQDCSTELCQCY